jgi:hypothetical protein
MNNNPASETAADSLARDMAAVGKFPVWVDMIFSLKNTSSYRTDPSVPVVPVPIAHAHAERERPAVRHGPTPSSSNV